MMNRLTLQLFVLLSIWWSADALLGFSKDRSLIFREPPIYGDFRASPLAVTLHTIKQRVDNFDPQNNATYDMRYYRNDEFFKPDSPIIIYVGGEWTINAGSLMGGGIYDLASELNAQLFYTEHRYYGRSLPTVNASTENLRYLSIDQALADLAHFIVEKKEESGRENSPVILVGGSYSATMVAWFRQKYPHLAIGAWASSAPVFAKVDFIEYKEVVGASFLQLGGPRCYSILQNAFADAEKLVKEKKYDEFLKTFGICDSFDPENKFDVWSAFSTFTDVLAGVVQYHDDGDIEDVCESFLENAENATDLDAFSKWFRDYLGLSGDRCFSSSYKEDIEFYQQTEWGSGATSGAGKQWFYQTCSEFGWYQTSGSKYQPFGSSFPVDLFYEMCKDIFGFSRSQMDLLIERKNTLYGGWNPEVDNVFFTHGQVDPWRTMGVQKDLNVYSPAAVIPGASHCKDLSSINSSDNTEMLSAKNKIKQLVKQWINEYNSNQ